MFCQVLAIFSFSEVVSDGTYSNRSAKYVKNVLDTFFICAEMTKIVKRRDDKHLSFLPYSVYKLKATPGSNMKPYLVTLSVDEIYRPACFIPVFENTEANSRNSFFSSRYFCFDLLFCDRSFWNADDSDSDVVPPYAADDPEDTRGFVLNSEQQLLTYSTVLENQRITDLDDSDSSDSADDIISDEDSDLLHFLNDFE